MAARSEASGLKTEYIPENRVHISLSYGARSVEWMISGTQTLDMTTQIRKGNSETGGKRPTQGGGQKNALLHGSSGASES